MKKRMLSIFICAVMLIGLLPTTTYAAHTNTIDVVTILDLEYPVQGKVLDTTYKVPESNVHYVKNEDDTGVTWYDLGTQGFGTSSGYDIVANERYNDILSQGATAQLGHYYMAKLELADTGMYDNNAEGGQFTNNVTVTYSYLPSRLKKADTYTPNQPYTLTVYLFFKADTMYDGYTNWLALSTEKLSSTVVDGDVVKCIIPAGREPWSLSEFAFSGYEENDFDISVNWFKETGLNKVAMTDAETTVAGQEYTLRVSLNSDKTDKNGYFDSGVFNDLYINEVIGERIQVGPERFQADFVCIAMASVDVITLEGIKAPEAYADMQTTGFNVGEGVEVSAVVWNQMSGVQHATPVTGKFQPNTDYRLMLTLEPQTGYMFNLDENNIELNLGNVDYYSNSNGIITVGIDFKVGSHTCIFANEWEKDEDNHWKKCECGEKNQVGTHTYDAGVITTAATCQKAGVKTYTCTVCGNKKTKEYTVSHSYKAVWEKDADNHWKACACGEKKEIAAHTYDAGIITKEATYTEKGIMIYTCSTCGYEKAQEIPVIEKVAAQKGITITDSATNSTYVVTKSDVTNGTVAFSKPKNKKVKKIKIPDTVTIDGITYKVTSIQKNAFNGCTKLNSVTIGKNVTTIGDKAFYKCKALKSITIPSKVSKIGKSAFEGCKKLKTIKVKTSKLTSKKVGNKAFKGTPANAKVTVPKKSLKSYKKFLYKKGVNKKAKIK